LQQDLELVADERRRKLVKGLGAIPGLEDKCPPTGDLTEGIA